MYFRDIQEQRFHAVLTAEGDGILSGVREAAAKAAELGLAEFRCGAEGQALSAGEAFASFSGTPKAIAMAEEQIIGTLAKGSGIASAARKAVALADGKVRIVSGSWKKMPPALKDMVRQAITAGGADFRICTPPMLYIDKNFIRMLGSVAMALRAADGIPEAKRVVQLKGLFCSLEEETVQAVEGGAQILMVDTGSLRDLERCQKQLDRMQARSRVQLAFAGGVRISEIPRMACLGMDILCIGKEIVDARLLDMRQDVV